jgi:AcrR family transcriptional regulator
MAVDQNSVKIARGYHHGALREALLAAAEEVLAERGIDGFSLRETARRAGVSPSAPAHHFRDAKGLLTALAAAAFAELADSLDAASEGKDRQERIRAQGHAYVAFALRRRAKFDLMWRAALLDKEDEAFQTAGHRAFLALDRAVRGEAAACDAKPADPFVVPSIAAWALVHGFARLAIDGEFGTAPGDAERAAEAMLPDVLRHLVV